MDIALLLVMLVVFYLLFMRPESKRKKEAENLRNNLKKGDRIVTIGGIIGKIVQVTDTTVVFETSEDRVRIEINKWGVQSILSAPAPGSKKAAKVEEPVEEELKAVAAEETAEKEDKPGFDPEIK